MVKDTGNVTHVMYLCLYLYLYLYLDLYVYLYLSHPSSCALNFILPACTLNVFQAASTTQRLSGPGVTGSVDTSKTQRAFTNPLKTVETVESFGIIFREVHHLKPKEPEEFGAVCKLKLLAFSLLCSLPLRANLKSKYLRRGLYLKLPQDVSACVTTKITT